ncbi:MAG: hypothetical protein JKY65_02980 [Planctomycetes bacterium]|nr:hypothetical protein [Planctomycetota bacterium]
MIASPASPSRRRRRQNAFAAVFLSAILIGAPGCATLTGFVTGAFTGAVDAPAQIYRINKGTFDYHPEYWIFNILFFVPVGLVVGPLAGMVKGAALDIQWAFLDQASYGKAFGTYSKSSIWRPYTIHWLR